MADIMSARDRSERMRLVKQRDTAPERALRRGLRRLGLRYRRGGRGLPGRPDIVFPRPGAAVFAHGCFWHHHRCRAGRLPASNIEFWTTKMAANVRRDRRKSGQLRALGWRVYMVWECQSSGEAKLARTVTRVVRWIEASA